MDRKVFLISAEGTKHEIPMRLARPDRMREERKVVEKLEKNNETGVEEKKEDLEIIKKPHPYSELLYTMTDEQTEEEEIELPLPNICDKEMLQVIEWLKYYDADPKQYKEIEKPLKSSVFTEVVPKWYADFCPKSNEDMFDLILAANYIGCKELLELLAANIGSIIKGKSVEELKAYFGVG